MDAEDLKLLNEIALIDQQLQIRTSDFELEENAIEKEDSCSKVDTQTPKELNLSCQRILKEIESKLLQMLEENLEKQKIMTNYLNDSSKKSETVDDNNMSKLIKCAGIPYFKDYYGYPQPRNEDVKERLACGELLSVDYLTNSCTWNKHDKESLTKAVMNDLKKKGNNEKSVDWLKISATDMNGKYSSSECESQWKLHLSPDVNKQKWSKSEIENLNLLAKKFFYQDWDKIAIELGTNRSGYQCCIQYQTKNSLNEGKWSLDEDNKLKSLVQRFKRNNHIPWTKISWFFQTRSRKQCQERYLEHLREGLKKGFFSPAEDKIIISGAKIFKDFGKLAKFLPGRAPTQIRSRYYYLIGTKMLEFTEEEDQLLLSLVKKHSKDWLSISQNFPHRSKLQCRKRYAALCRENLAENKFRQDIEDWKKLILNPTKMIKQEKPKQKGKRKNDREVKNTEERVAYNNIIKYHENCSENYFGPRLKNPTTEEDLKIVSLKLRTTMAMLSVSCDFSEKTEKIKSLKNDCNFDIYDIKVLQKLAEEDSSTKNTLKENYFLHGMLIPPNRGTLTGYHTILTSRASIKMGTCEAEGLSLPSTESIDDKTFRDRLSFSKAKALFRSRMRSIFLLSLIVSRIPTGDLSQEIYHKGKAKKPKKLTKKRLKNHSREMNAAYREKQRKLKEAAASVEVITDKNGTES